MNFKPTLLKLIISTLIGFITRILISFIYTISAINSAAEHNSLIYQLWLYNLKFPKIFIIIPALVIYIIWSLVQKKNSLNYEFFF